MRPIPGAEPRVIARTMFSADGPIDVMSST